MSRYEVAGMGAALNAPDLSDEEARELAAQAKSGDQAARDELVLRHLRLIEQIANRLAEQWKRSSDDLFSEACLVFLEGLDSFDPREWRNSFVTWAGWYVAFKLGQQHYHHGNPEAVIVLRGDPEHNLDPIDITVGDLRVLRDLVVDFDLVVARALRQKWIDEAQAEYLRAYLQEKSLREMSELFPFKKSHIGQRLRTALEVVREIARNER